MTEKNKKAFINFINLSLGQKEASVAIAKTEKEQADFVKILDLDGFKESKVLYELMENPKTYFMAGKNLDKGIYDFFLQYPTGQIEIFDKKIMESSVYYPKYENRAVVIIVLKNDLKKLRKNNFDLLAVTGLAYQS